MKPSQTQISGTQFFCILFLSRIFGLLTFPNKNGETLSAGTGGLIVFTFLPFALLLSLPVLLLSGKTPGLRGNEEKKPAKTICFLLYAAFFLLQGLLAAAELERFLGHTMFQGSSHPFLMLLFLFLCAVTAFSGLQTVARAAPPVLLFFLCAVGLICAATLRYFEPANLSSTAAADGKTLVKNGVLCALRTAEPAALLFCPTLQKQRTGGLPLTLGAIGATGSLLFSLIAGVTGAFGETQEYQFFTLTTLSELGTVERMDDLLCVLWVFCAMLKTVFYFTLSLRALGCAGLFCQSRTAKVLFCLICCGVYLPLTKLDFLFQFFYNRQGNMLFVFFFVTVFPLAILFRRGVENKRGKKVRP